MALEKVTDAKMQVTDKQVLSLFAAQNIDKDFVEFHDYDRTRPYAKLYKDRASDKQIQVISGLPMCRKDDGSKTLAGWERSGDTLHNKNNLFEAELKGSRLALSVTNDQPSGITTKDELVWNPQLFIGGEEIALLSSAILETDPINENYHDNVICFEYGVCRRFLRIIEGRMREWWEFAEKPTGEVRVKHNQEGKIFLKLGHGASGMIPLDIAVENDDVEVLSNLDYKLPFSIGATATFYPDANTETATVDGRVWRTGASDTWASYRTGAGTHAADDEIGSSSAHRVGFAKSTTDTTTYSELARLIALFDTSSLTDTDTITNAVLSFIAGTSFGNHPFGISTSNPASNTELAATDYDVTDFGSTLLASNCVQYGLTTYTDFTFNPAGIAAISKTGITKLALRSVYDIRGIEPYFVGNPAYGSFFIAYVRMSEYGAGSKPKLVITTETPSGGREPRALYHGV